MQSTGKSQVVLSHRRGTDNASEMVFRPRTTQRRGCQKGAMATTEGQKCAKMDPEFTKKTHFWDSCARSNLNCFSQILKQFLPGMQAGSRVGPPETRQSRRKGYHRTNTPEISDFLRKTTQTFQPLGAKIPPVCQRSGPVSPNPSI